LKDRILCFLDRDPENFLRKKNFIDERSHEGVAPLHPPGAPLLQRPPRGGARLLGPGQKRNETAFNATRLSPTRLGRLQEVAAEEFDEVGDCDYDLYRRST